MSNGYKKVKNDNKINACGYVNYDDCDHCYLQNHGLPEKSKYCDQCEDGWYYDQAKEPVVIEAKSVDWFIEKINELQAELYKIKKEK